MMRNGEIFGVEGCWRLGERGVMGDMMSGMCVGAGFGGGGKYGNPKLGGDLGMRASRTETESSDEVNFGGKMKSGIALVEKVCVWVVEDIVGLQSFSKNPNVTEGNDQVAAVTWSKSRIRREPEIDDCSINKINESCQDHTGNVCKR